MQHIIAYIITIPTLYRVEYLKRIKSSIAYTMIENMIVPAVTLKKGPGNVKKNAISGVHIFLENRKKIKNN